MRHFTRAIFLVFLLITGFFIKAQAPPTQAPVLLNVQGKIYDDNDVLNGAVITVTQGGRTVSTITTGSDGKYSFQLPLGGDYMVTVSKPDMITKKFSITTRGIPPERALEPFGVVDAQISLWKKVDGVDYSALNQPANKYAYDGTKQNFDYDKGYLDQMLGVIEGIREQEKAIEKKNKDLEKNYQAAIKEGDKNFGKKDYPNALAKYNEALGLKKDDPTAKQKIEQVNQAMKADAAAKAKADADAAAKKKAEEDAKAKAAA
ncbi:MAG TPA: carboxypeptidase-like regulatory domain-containing protein, partial [Bacteroidia bacterium]|nr:carboxypeptidase-like regulatory domain-containing protein [Bacteroidia bacterium]